MSANSSELLDIRHYKKYTDKPILKIKGESNSEKYSEMDSLTNHNHYPNDVVNIEYK